MPGLRFWWMWEEFGFQAKLDVHLRWQSDLNLIFYIHFWVQFFKKPFLHRREQIETPVTYVTDVYTAMWNITSDPVFKYGTWTYLPVSESGTKKFRLKNSSTQLIFQIPRGDWLHIRGSINKRKGCVSLTLVVNQERVLLWYQMPNLGMEMISFLSQIY